jgi:hypothetical protein
MVFSVIHPLAGRLWGPALIASVLVATAAPERETGSFRTDILPILTKAGCNAGACHGAATGQGGFKLSLLGYDPEEDYERITRELGGRRIDLNSPADSLFLRKPARQLAHEGGRRLPRDSGEYQVLLQWLARGAAYGRHDLAVQRLSVQPKETVFGRTNETTALRVTAWLSDGSERDVTALALYTANDDAVADVDRTGLITARGPGLTSVMVRYSGQVGSARLILPFANPAPAGAGLAIHNFVDQSVAAELKRLRLPASPPSAPAEFLRRVSLDVAGRLPTPAEVRSFLARPDTQSNRVAIVNQLLASDGFVDLWTLHFADLLLIGGKGANERAVRAYQGWLRERINRNAPLDETARLLLTAGGALAENPAASFYSLATDPRDLAEQVARIFLGTQIACARCHAHPADRWTQDDYYGFSAFFARVNHDGDRIKISARGELNHPKTGRPVAARLLGNDRPIPSREATADPRVDLADWLVGPDNPLFARSIVNRVWKHLFGRGLVESPDDLRPTNPPVYPELLEKLAADFAAHHFDLRQLIRTLVTSQTYQLSSASVPGNRADHRFFSHAYLKELPAPVFLDAIAQATGIPDTFEGDPGARALELTGVRTPSYALDVLGRCSREKTCEAPARAGGGIAQALHLINGPLINGKLQGGTVETLLAQGGTDSQVIEELYVRALARLPLAAESAEWTGRLAAASDRTAAVQDLFWGLLNSREFAFNH